MIQSLTSGMKWYLKLNIVEAIIMTNILNKNLKRKGSAIYFLWNLVEIKSTGLRGI